MTFDSFISQAQKAVSVLSNPRESAVLASAAAGAFSAETNNYRKQALGALENFGAKLGPKYSSVLGRFLKPAEQVLSGDGSIPESPSGRIMGLTYLQAGIAAAGLFVVVIFMLGRSTR